MVEDLVTTIKRCSIPTLFSVTDRPSTCPPPAVWRGTATKFDETLKAGVDDSYDLRIYPDNVLLKGVNKSSLEALGWILEEVPPNMDEVKLVDVLNAGDGPLKGEAIPNGKPDIYVCTHQERDCRCGTVGEAFHQALTSENRENLADISRISHIGGHKFAANAITYPSGDWYGRFRPKDTASFLAAVTQGKTLWQFWRGRMSLEKKEQELLSEQHAAELIATSGALSEDTKTEDPTASTAAEVTLHIHMPRHNITHTIPAKVGSTLMEVLCAANVDPEIPIEATCGGQCECATCHVYLRDPQDYEHIARERPMKDEEDDMLDYAIQRVEGASRLSCQLVVQPDWEGLTIEIPRFM